MKTVLISDIAGDLFTSPLRYFLEIKRGWTQLGIRNPITPLYKFKPSVFGIFLARDVLFRLGFNSSFYMLHGDSQHMNATFMSLVFSLTLGVWFSQFADLIFIRITNEQVGKYKSVKDAFLKIKREEGLSRFMMSGFNHRFNFLFLYYGTIIFSKEISLKNKDVQGMENFIN